MGQTIFGGLSEMTELVQNRLRFMTEFGAIDWRLQMADWKTTDTSGFDSSDNDESKTQRQIWVPCRICREIFERVRLTALWCGTCGRSFCEGEHGSFKGRGRGVCVRCYTRAQAKSELLQH